jgi:hypothetical protein
VVGALLKLGQSWVFGQFALVIIVGAIAVALLGEETRRKRLEEI